jgi:hypothetical protein
MQNTNSAVSTVQLSNLKLQYTIHNTPSYILIMQLNMLSQTARRVSKLTDKAKAAIEERIDSSRKRKDAISRASVAPSKKAKPTQPDGHPKDGSHNPDDITNVSPPGPPPVQKNHRAIVRTEEEEAEWENAQLIEDDSENGRSVPHDSSPEVETAEEELSKINYLNEISR